MNLNGLKPKVDLLYENGKIQGVALGIEVDGNIHGEDNGDVIKIVGEVMARVKTRHYTLNPKTGAPVLSEGMATSDWEKEMRKSSLLHKTRVGNFMIVTAFIGVEAYLEPKEGDFGVPHKVSPQLFGVIIFRIDRERMKMHSAATIESAAEIHKTAIRATKRFEMRMPWTIVRDRLFNGYWV